ncbi:MAG: hypothetical protein ACSLEW_09180 [Nocardioides sp.]
MDNASWGALALALTVAGGTWTYFAFRSGRTGAALQIAGITLLAPAAWLTGLLKVVGRVTDAVSDWAIRFVFSPSAWLGIIVAGVAAMVFAAGTWLKARQSPATSKVASKAAVSGAGRGSKARPGSSRAGSSGTGSPGSPAGAEFDDIEELLRKHGIN